VKQFKTEKICHNVPHETFFGSKIGQAQLKFTSKIGKIKQNYPSKFTVKAL